MQSAVHEVLSSNERLLIDQAIAEHENHPGALLGILEAVQSANAHKYLSMEALRYIAEETGVPAARIYSAATFYALFNLDPQGDNVICVCRGTACHTRGSRDLLEKLCLDLGLSEHEASDTTEADKIALTTPDHKIHDSHRGLLWAVRSGSGGRGEPPHSEPCKRAHIAARSEGSDRRGGNDAAHSGYRRIQRGARIGACQADAGRSAPDGGDGDLRPRQRRRRGFSRAERGDPAATGWTCC